MTNGDLPYYPTESGPFKLEFLGHADTASYDSEAGYPGAALEFAHRWHIHRDTINVFDRAFSPWLEATSGIKRKIDDELTKRRREYSVNPNKITPLQERFVKYANRVIATLKTQGKLDLVSAIEAEALRVSRSIKINVAPAAVAAPVAPMFFARADSLLAIGDLDELNGKLSRYLALVPSYELARDQDLRPVRDSLARLLQRFSEAALTQDD